MTSILHIPIELYTELLNGLSIKLCVEVSTFAKKRLIRKSDNVIAFITFLI